MAWVCVVSSCRSEPSSPGESRYMYKPSCVCRTTGSRLVDPALSSLGRADRRASVRAGTLPAGEQNYFMTQHP